ncbi:MAG: AAA family ATPase [Chloroflexi bacterium]|nr:AAA family ATPase [Chloroflexota bacterium]
MADLKIHLFGCFQVSYQDTPLTGFKSDKVRALLAYLAIETRLHARTSLAGLLWPELSEEAANSNLRSSLANLRKIFEKDAGLSTPVLLIDHHAVRFNPNVEVECDVIQFEAATKEGNLETAVHLYRGELLEGLYSRSIPFDDWLEMRAEGLHQKALYALNTLSRENFKRGDFEQAMRFARRQLELESTSEEAHRQIIYILAVNGQRSAALAQFERCKRLLKKELSIDPAPETIQLVAAIRQGRLLSPISMPVKFRAVGEPQEKFVSRERELAWLDAHLRAALSMHGNVVFITGDAGSGKSSLAEAFMRQAIQSDPRLVAVKGNCNALGGIDAPYLAFREILRTLVGSDEQRWKENETELELNKRLIGSRARVNKILEDFSPVLHKLLLSGQNDAVEEYIYQAQPIKHSYISEQFTLMVRELSRQTPLLLVLDDLQWADEESLQLLLYLGQRLSDMPVMITGIFRSEEVSAGRGSRRHPLETIVHQFQALSGEVCLDLNKSDGKAFIRALLDSYPNQFEDGFHDLLYQRTGGHALFTVELLDSLQSQGNLKQNKQGRWEARAQINWQKIPTRIEAVVAERIGRLPPFWRSALTVASVEGERFTAEALALILNSSVRVTIRGLSEVAGRQHGLVVSQGTRMINGRRLTFYRFRHILFQRYLYQHLDDAERPYLHKSLANALEEVYREDRFELNALAPQLAWHYEQAGEYSKAAEYFFLAGRDANQLAAMSEAAGHLNHVLGLLEGLPVDPARKRLAMNTHMELSITYLALFGWGSEQRELALKKAYRLARELEEIQHQLHLSAQIADNYVGGRNFQSAIEIGEELIHLSEQQDEKNYLILGQRVIGESMIVSGRIAEGTELLHTVLPYIIEHQDAPEFRYLGGQSDSLRIYLALGSLISGYPERAGQMIDDVILHIDEHNSGILNGYAMTMALIISILIEDTAKVAYYIPKLENLVKTGEYNVYQPWLWVANAWQDARQGKREYRIKNISSKIFVWQQLKSFSGYPFLIHTAVALLLENDLVDECEKILDSLLQDVETFTGPGIMYARLIAQKGEIRLRRGDTAGAEAHFNKAIQVARWQGAKLWELSTIMNLCRLKHQQGYTAEYYPMLQEIYAWFGEGFDRPLLRQARALLDEMQSALN